MPLRTNSRLIADQNMRNIAGRPLFAWSLEQAIRSQCFDAIYVATNSSKIRKKVLDEFSSSVTILDRSPETCTDTASTDSVLIEFKRQIPFDVVCLIQATSPLTRAEDFYAAKDLFIEKNLDSLLTVVQSKRLFWTKSGTPINYDPTNRPRRQDFDGCMMENSAFYLTRAKILENFGCRLGGRIGVHKMAAETAIEIDDAIDWIVVEQLLLRQKSLSIREQVLRVKVLVLDVDGTLTDGGMYYGSDGEALKKFNTRDAHGLQLLRENGVKICVISAEDSPAVAAKMNKLGIDEYYPGVEHKFLLLEELARRWDITLQNIAYIGNDHRDLECLKFVGTAFCPADSAPEILQQTHYICKHFGGNGAVREVCDVILQINVATTTAL